MNGLHRVSLFLLCIMVVAACGCTSPAVNDARYGNGGISVGLTAAGDIPDAWVQVTVYQLKDFQQRQYMVVSTPAMLTTGTNEVFLAAPLEPGSYKLYIYLFVDGERKTTVIRDIVVN